MLFVMILILSLFFCLALGSMVPKECEDATEAFVVDEMFSVFVQSLFNARPAKCLSSSFLLNVWQV